MAHLSYEAARTIASQPDVTNAELLERLGPFISLVIQRQMLDVHQQMGLTAELMFLIELLNFAGQQDSPVNPREALVAWKGGTPASRDFVGRQVAVEVKSTSQPVRLHAVHPMYQLLAEAEQPDERVYVYSVGLKQDRSSTFKVVTAFERVLGRLDSDAKVVFQGYLAQYGRTGFDANMKSHYNLEPGFVVTLPGELYRVDRLPDILRPEAFSGGQPPSRASKLRYDVSLDGLPPLQRAERETVLRGLLYL